jgi:hypothetical protein
MKKHVKIYLNYFGFGEQSFIPSEISGKRANDIHHIENRGSGGSKNKDYIKNLMALTREEHEKYGDKKEYIEYLKLVHKNYMNAKKS